MVKKIAVFVILILSGICCLTGCAHINYSRVYSADGVIIDDVTISLSKDTFDSEAKARAVFDAVKADVQALDLAIDNWVKDNFGGKYVGTDSMESYFASGYNIGLASNISDQNDCYEYYFYIEYRSLEHFIYFYGLNTDSVIETYGLHDVADVQPFMSDDFGPFISQILIGNYNIDDPNIFIRDLVWSKDNAYHSFSDMTKSNGDKYLDCYIDIANVTLDEDYSKDTVLDNIEFTERYETTENRYDCNGKKYVDSSGYVVHEWEINDISDQITFMRHRPNQAWWYVSAVVVTMAVALILLVLYRKKGDKE